MNMMTSFRLPPVIHEIPYVQVAAEILLSCDDEKCKYTYQMHSAKPVRK